MCAFLRSDPAAASTSLEDVHCIRSCNNFSLVVIVRKRECSEWSNLPVQNNLSPLVNTPNIMGTLRSAEFPSNIERITSSKTFSLRVVYSKLLDEKLWIVKLVRILRKNFLFFFFFYLSCTVHYTLTSMPLFW